MRLAILTGDNHVGLFFLPCRSAQVCISFALMTAIAANCIQLHAFQWIQQPVGNQHHYQNGQYLCAVDSAVVVNTKTKRLNPDRVLKDLFFVSFVVENFLPVINDK